MILGLPLQTFTIVHVAISVLGLVSGFVVLIGLLGANVRWVWTAVFLITTVLTTVTGFLFPITILTPALVTGLLSSPILAIALYALYVGKLDGAWRWVYAVSAVAALYLNVVALIAQSFLKMPIFYELAPTGTEPPFVIAQALAFAGFVLVGALSVMRFRPLPRMATT